MAWDVGNSITDINSTLSFKSLEIESQNSPSHERLSIGGRIGTEMHGTRLYYLIPSTLQKTRLTLDSQHQGKSWQHNSDGVMSVIRMEKRCQVPQNQWEVTRHCVSRALYSWEWKCSLRHKSVNTVMLFSSSPSLEWFGWKLVKHPLLSFFLPHRKEQFWY